MTRTSVMVHPHSVNPAVALPCGSLAALCKDRNQGRFVADIGQEHGPIVPYVFKMGVPGYGLYPFWQKTAMIAAVVKLCPSQKVCCRGD